jgi:hypothetical protein
MHDPESRGAALLGALFVLTVVIGVLGGSVALRSARALHSTGSRGPLAASSAGATGAVLLTLALLVVAFLGVFFPPVAALPALLFLVQGVRTWQAGRGFPREAGAVMLLAALGWGLYLPYQMAMIDWSRTVSAPIRVDILIVVPLMGAISFFGWWVKRYLPERAG